MVRHLFIVAQDQPGLYDYLTRHFSEDKEVHVLRDRRLWERRQSGQALESNRRLAARRSQSIDDELRAFGFAILH